MQVTLLGTGCPSVDLNRHGPATLVQAGDSALLVDCGAGVSHRLVEAGTPGARVDALLLTHLHSDHIVDLFQLIISSWHQGREQGWRIFGPSGTRRYVDGLMRLWQPELEQRIAHERRPSTAALKVSVEEIGDGQRLQLGGMQVEVVEVDHAPVKQAFGFVFDGDGQRCALSGDTRRCPALIEAARDVDLLVHEVFVHRDMPVVDGVRSAETVRNVASYHTLSAEVGGIARDAGARILALTHFVPPAAERDALLREVTGDFAGPVLLGEDLMCIDLDTDTVRYGLMRLALCAPPRR